MAENNEEIRESAKKKAAEVFDFAAPANEKSHVKKVIGVISGKGGVGKSLVTSLLAVDAANNGLKSAILDADITGPSIPKMFGLHGKAYATYDGIMPMQASNGTEIMSINLILDNETDPVIWRGPVIAGTVKQFWTEVVWEDVDVMFIDMPPGTGDVTLTVFQSLPVDGVIIVSSPQELVGMIVEKAVKMAEIMHIPVLGLVENMSYIKCPHCGEEIRPYGESHLAELAEKHGIKATASLPIDPSLAEACDDGAIASIDVDWLAPITEAIKAAPNKA